jgi:macrolide-specific efflux system membrane fusion protein
MKSRRKWILVAGILGATVLGFALWKRSQSSQVTYKEVTVKKGNLTVSILSTGIVQPETRLEIKPPVAGRAEKVLVNEGNRVRKGDVLVWMSSTERAALLDAARARGSEELKTWEEYYKATPVLAPLSGMIIQRNIQPGQTFATTDPILVMSDRLTVQAQVDETDIAEVKLKQRATIVLDAYPKNTIQARVDKIAYDAKTVNNVTTYIVYVLPDDTPPYMRSGMTANVSFTVDTRNNVLLLPSEAVKKKPDGTSYALRNDPSYGEKPLEVTVEVGLSDGKSTEIISGLSEGATVVMPQLKIGRTPIGGNPFSPMGGSRRFSR